MYKYLISALQILTWIVAGGPYLWIFAQFLYNIKNFKTLRTKKKRKEVKQQQYLDKSYFSFFGNFSIINLLQTYLLNTIRNFSRERRLV